MLICSPVDTLLGHLNAPYGPLVRREHLMAALSAGRLAAVSEPVVRSILASIFVECAPHSLAAAAAELGVGRHHLEALYLDCVEHGESRCTDWELAIAMAAGD
jgi:hypothetical protein